MSRVKKRQRRLNGVDEIALSLYARGLATGKMPLDHPLSTWRCNTARYT